MEQRTIEARVDDVGGVLSKHNDMFVMMEEQYARNTQTPEMFRHVTLFPGSTERAAVFEFEKNNTQWLPFVGHFRTIVSKVVTLELLQKLYPEMTATKVDPKAVLDLELALQRPDPNSVYPASEEQLPDFDTEERRCDDLGLVPCSSADDDAALTVEIEMPARPTRPPAKDKVDWTPVLGRGKVSFYASTDESMPTLVLILLDIHGTPLSRLIHGLALKKWSTMTFGQFAKTPAYLYAKNLELRNANRLLARVLMHLGVGFTPMQDVLAVPREMSARSEPASVYELERSLCRYPLACRSDFGVMTNVFVANDAICQFCENIVPCGEPGVTQYIPMFSRDGVAIRGAPGQGFVDIGLTEPLDITPTFSLVQSITSVNVGVMRAREENLMPQVMTVAAATTL